MLGAAGLRQVSEMAVLNANYLLQKQLPQYAIGSETKTTLTREKLHQDPNLNYAASVAVILTRLPHSEKLTPIETMKLAAGEIAGPSPLPRLAWPGEAVGQVSRQAARAGDGWPGGRGSAR